MKGIILAGGNGTRLRPLTTVVSKQLLPVCDKPMIFYPLSTLMLAGVRDILVITNPGHVGSFRDLLGTGYNLGVRFSYASQLHPGGIAEALLVAHTVGFLQAEPVMLILGDNLFHSDKLAKKLQSLAAGFDAESDRGAFVFAQRVMNPNEYGVLELSEHGHAMDIHEKPSAWVSDLAVTGLYVYDQRALGFVRNLERSARGELEITDLNRAYIRASELGDLAYEVLGRGAAWFDTGTPEMLLEASNFVSIVQARQDVLIGSPEEVAYRMGFIRKERFMKLVDAYPHGSSYRVRLQRLLSEES